jgi:hypothetical protein
VGVSARELAFVLSLDLGPSGFLKLAGGGKQLRPSSRDGSNRLH